MQVLTEFSSALLVTPYVGIHFWEYSCNKSAKSFPSLPSSLARSLTLWRCCGYSAHFRMIILLAFSPINGKRPVENSKLTFLRLNVRTCRGRLTADANCQTLPVAYRLTTSSVRWREYNGGSRVMAQLHPKRIQTKLRFIVPPVRRFACGMCDVVLIVWALFLLLEVKASSLVSLL